MYCTLTNNRKLSNPSNGKKENKNPIFEPLIRLAPLSLVFTRLGLCFSHLEGGGVVGVEIIIHRRVKKNPGLSDTLGNVEAKHTRRASPTHDFSFLVAKKRPSTYRPYIKYKLTVTVWDS